MRAVLLIDMSRYADTESEQLVVGFVSLEEAREFARRRVWDSVEELRGGEDQTPEALRQVWFLYGTDALVLEGDYVGSLELDRFVASIASPEERDWRAMLLDLDGREGWREIRVAELAEAGRRRSWSGERS